jgi:hypothetical protein
MNAARYTIALAALVAPLVAKTPPVRLLSCVVSNAGLLEAEVENTSDSAQACSLRCDYVVGETTISHRFEISIPARFRGIVGQVDTWRGQPGSYPGLIGMCRKMPRP